MFEANQRVRDEFIRWIEQPQFNPQHAKNWARLYINDPEAAMCEATYWAVMSDCGVSVAPNADLTGKPAPDFVCLKTERKFYVEVTCIREETATRQTGLNPNPSFDGKASSYASLNDAIFHECISKTPQCAGLDAPCIIAIGTFHHQASILGVREVFIECLLTGQTNIGVQFDATEGRCVGEPYEMTRFRSAAFTRIAKSSVEHARHPISGVLVGGFGCSPPAIFGALHPSPVREFDPTILDRIPFCCQAINLEAGTVGTHWIRGTSLESR